MKQPALSLGKHDNIFLRRLHNFALSFSWLLGDLLNVIEVNPNVTTSRYSQNEFFCQ